VAGANNNQATQWPRSYRGNLHCFVGHQWDVAIQTAKPLISTFFTLTTLSLKSSFYVILLKLSLKSSCGQDVWGLLLLKRVAVHCSNIVEAEAAVSVNEKKWLCMLQLQGSVRGHRLSWLTQPFYPSPHPPINGHLASPPAPFTFSGTFLFWTCPVFPASARLGTAPPLTRASTYEGTYAVS
jgi:hypothetical protein